eukprot:PhM_4_TR5895/c0_g2_i1/m.67467
MKWVVGSKNKAKVASVEAVAHKCFPNDTHEVISVDVPSGVAAQPMDLEVTISGARNRAKGALELVQDADFAVGLEGGIERIGTRFFECGWMVVVDRNGREGVGSAARYELSEVLMRPILDEGKELAQVMDAVTGESDVRSNWGAMGVLTAGHLPRAEAYSQGLIFALAPFLSERKYWEQ